MTNIPEGQKLGEQEKSLLKKRITKSVQAHIRSRRNIRYAMGMAATFLIGFSVYYGLLTSDDRTAVPMENMVNSNENSEQLDQVRLVLGDDNTIEIPKENPQITYSPTGQEVFLGNETVNQETATSRGIIFNTLMVPYGKRSEIVLSDQSRVWLNSGSKLRFPASFQGDRRTVYLEGEAIFEVAHDKEKPFVVKTGEQEIEVLGTVFNVSNYHDDPEIITVLKSGSIALTDISDGVQNERSIKIAPNTMATFRKGDGTIETGSVNVEPYFSWRDGVFIFHKDPFRKILKKLSRYYNIKIDIKDEELANQTFSGYLDVTEHIEHVIQTINETASSKFTYHLTEDDQLIIIKE
ncbi:FecR family protein [Flagellimonas iocasae]|uniref:FecR family protein n=1 Tax=Flagellimonas iocasae TaxID=2055905 RepID=A0ABW4Y0H0_9FLAO